MIGTGAWLVLGGLFLLGLSHPVVAMAGLAAGVLLHGWGPPEMAACAALAGIASTAVTWWRARRSRRGPCAHRPGFAKGWDSWFHHETRRTDVDRAARAAEGSKAAQAAFLSGRILAILLWTVCGVGLMEVAHHYGVRVLGHEPGLDWGDILLIIYAMPKVVLVPLAVSGRGRRFLITKFSRWSHHEYWATWFYYVPLFAWAVVKFGIRPNERGGLAAMTCCNPEIGSGGGLAGESKHMIMTLLGARDRCSSVLATELIGAGDVGARLLALDRVLEGADGRLAYPLVLKPDQGERGFAVKIIRSRADAARYFELMPAPAVVQPFHEGPEECGILWVRGTPEFPARQGLIGSVYSLTRKEFPRIAGDGISTIQDLVLADRRFRRQSGVFFERFGDEVWRVPARGEVVRLANSGNHSQGTKFMDGETLITSALEAQIDQIASRIPRLDIARFDVRYSSEVELREGRGFAVLEMNGTAAESTNMYDPGRSLWWSYSVVAGLWRRMIILGKRRFDEGVPAMSVRSAIGMCRAHFKGLRGPRVAD